MNRDSRIIKNTTLWIVGFLLLILLTLVIYMIVQDNMDAPGVTWKVTFAQHPELQEIYEKFVQSCQTPEIPVDYFTDIESNSTFQQMRIDCTTMTLDLEEKYTIFEDEPKENSIWADPIKQFYGIHYAIPETELFISDIKQQFSQQPIKEEKASNCSCQQPTRILEYTPRLGCYIRNIPAKLENFASNKIKDLMKRLNITYTFDRLSDSRGATYMPPGGFMEMHSNRNHFAGWRLYMHYLPENGSSWFAYRHPFDHSYRRIADENKKGNLFRIRKPPKNVLWHSIYSDTPRFSWGIWLDPGLGQYLKNGAIRI